MKMQTAGSHRTVWVSGLALCGEKQQRRGAVATGKPGLRRQL